ncbi:DUF4359 domain-containing protein [Rubrivirga sp. S365]|uniref:DUF4359 domain-containing protein n=1 Tax=Rubrivirga litoralis TaxID=3075598 RepID=A0ABU3BLJ8_9BACT|nr:MULTISPECIES: DUF4359 domain-containing protein [unclassified Rubrivirga]MDT0630157.1 DUF4359 domain-containing protein [Rubrivirga sp. F394]MDT7855668.1 DUF4359 domain-containing protein [Rubrivirga sp. S365]
MTPFRVLLVGLLLIAGLLYVLNPGPEAFRRFLTEELAAQAEQRARDAGEEVGGSSGGRVAGVIARRLGREAGALASEAFEREDYYVASVYRVDINGRRPGGEWAFLGIANQFFPIEAPEL